MPKLFLSIAVFLVSQLALADVLTLNNVLQRAASGTTDRTIIEQTYIENMSDVQLVTSSALPQVTSEITSNRMSLSTVGTNSSANGGAAGQGFGLTQTTQQAGDLPERAYGSSYGWGINLRTPILAFGRLGTLWDIKNGQEKMLGDSRAAQIQRYYVQVVQAYSEAILNLNRYQAAVRAETYAKAVADFTKFEYEGGGRSRVDYLRAKSFASLALAEKQRAQNLNATSVERLKVLIGIPVEESVELRPGVDNKISFLQIKDAKKGPRRDITLKEQEVDLNSKWADYRRASHWPTLYLVGGAKSSLSQIDYGAFKTNEDADPQDVFASNRHTYTVGLALTWTIFDGYRTTAESRKAAAALIKSKAQLDKLHREDKTARTEASENVRVANLVQNAASDAETAARLAFEQTDSDYKAGISSLTEMLEVQKDLSNTENELFQAYANKILAVANYKWVHGIDIAGEQ
jgi:outer membrane protein TolC